jgi:hypothetical protein
LATAGAEATGSAALAAAPQSRSAAVAANMAVFNRVRMGLFLGAAMVGGFVRFAAILISALPPSLQSTPAG